MGDAYSIDPSSQLQALLQVGQALTTGRSLERVLLRIVETAREALAAGYAALGVIDEGGAGLSHFVTAGIAETAKAAVGPPPTGKGILGLLIREGRPIRLRHLSEHPDAAGFPPGHPPMQSFLGVPIRGRDKVYGNLYFAEKQGASEFSDTDEALALLLAAQAGVAIENALTLQGLRAAQASADRDAGQLQALAQASLAMTTELSLDRVLVRIAEAARDVLSARYAALGVIDKKGTGLSQFVTAGIDEATTARIGPLPTGRGVLGLLIKEGRPIRMRALSDHPQAVGFPPNHPPMRSFLGVPIAVRGKVYGNLYVTEKQGAEEFSQADETVALMLASQAGIAIENAGAFQALRAAQDEMVRQERLATLGQLAGSVAHELRSPLAVVKNSVYYLRVLGTEDERARKHLDILDREVATVNRIVTDLLDFTRVKRPVLARTLLNEVLLRVLDRRPPPPGVVLDANLDSAEPVVEVDSTHLEQILDNLVSNAFQSMASGGTLTIKSGTASGRVFASVADTGVGIPTEHLEKIFQPLFTTRAKGIGLGLSLARDLATANAATITVESQPGAGSCFTLSFAGGAGG
jgi:signal transduction histidine kinase